MKQSRLSIAIQALTDITNPLAKIQRENRLGMRLNGVMASWLINDPAYLQEIARQALREIKERK
jgi:hypothetical protein